MSFRVSSLERSKSIDFLSIESITFETESENLNEYGFVIKIGRSDMAPSTTIETVTVVRPLKNNLHMHKENRWYPMLYDLYLVFLKRMKKDYMLISLIELQRIHPQDHAISCEISLFQHIEEV
ncbi:UNVERIFIED_CONTAM: hypothetical protein NCL1_30102 [Trichonephila clavipes]